MIAYLDSSVLLRIVLRQRNALKEWRSLDQGIASALVEVECLRTLDRLRLAEGLDDTEIAMRREHTGGDLTMATHDVALGNATKATGLRMVGL